MLVVAINSDASVARLKGDGRPLLPEAERAETLRALEASTACVIYDEATPIEVMRALLPDVLVKGADWAADADRRARRGRGGRRPRGAGGARARAAPPRRSSTRIRRP